MVKNGKKKINTLKRFNDRIIPHRRQLKWLFPKWPSFLYMLRTQPSKLLRFPNFTTETKLLF